MDDFEVMTQGNAEQRHDGQEGQWCKLRGSLTVNPECIRERDMHLCPTRVRGAHCRLSFRYKIIVIKVTMSPVIRDPARVVTTGGKSQSMRITGDVVTTRRRILSQTKWRSKWRNARHPRVTFNWFQISLGQSIKPVTN